MIKLDFLTGSGKLVLLILINALYAALVEYEEGRGIIYNFQGQTWEENPQKEAKSLVCMRNAVQSIVKWIKGPSNFKD